MSEREEKQKLLEFLRAEIEKLLCDDSISETEKISRMKKAEAIILGN